MKLLINKVIIAGTILVIYSTMNSLKSKLQELEKKEILNALREYNGIMARAARKLGITERMIGYKMYKIGKGGIEAVGSKQ